MMNLERVNAGLSGLGMKVTAGTTEAGHPQIEASIETKKGQLYVFAIDKGARLAKPNGTVKYLYECTEAKLRAVVLQTIKANS